jgi:tetratricopeptide (TPR) repeat protein
VLEPLMTAWRLETRLQALLVRGRAFAALGALDSALACWDAVADEHPSAVEPAAEARFLRGTGLEAAGRWEEARTEYRALGATYPTHRLAVRAMGRIVEYHARRGQGDLAGIEGRRAIEALDRLILRQRDLDVQYEARLMRARLLEAVGPPAEACDALTAFWRRYPRSYEGQEAGLRAAMIADSALHDRERAGGLYMEMDERPIRTVVRDRARAALAALGAED